MDGHLFRSEDLAVRARLRSGTGPCVITFDSYTDHRTLDRKGFGEDFFDELGIDAIHVLSRQNDWYQHHELLDAAAAVREIVADRERVLAYGSSMGGYAAIRFGGLFGATLAASFSPQFSIDPLVAPFERRWIGDGARIDFHLERRGIAFTPKCFVFYDPRDADRLHVDLFRAGTELIDVPIPIGGHPCTTILAETHLLRPLILQILRTGEIDDFQTQYRAARRRSPQFFFNLSMAAKRPRARALLAERAYRLDNCPMYASHYGQMLAFDGRFNEARALMRSALESEPDNLIIKYRHSESLEAEGDLASALETMDRIFALTSDIRAFRPRREQLAKWLSERWRAQFSGSFSQQKEHVDAVSNEPVAEPPSRLRRILPAWFGGPKPRPPPGVALDPTSGQQTARSAADADVLLTTVPAPPQFTLSWRRHLGLLKLAPAESQDLLLVGDSLAEWWPDRCWPGLRVSNFGIAGDRTQHLLWRLSQLPDGALHARCALVMIGTNNLGCGDSAEAIAAGVDHVLRILRQKVQANRLVLMEIPPMGSDFKWRGEERLRTHEKLRALGVETLNVDQALIAGVSEGSLNYAQDGIHFSEAGYEILTEVVLGMLASDAKAPIAAGSR